MRPQVGYRGKSTPEVIPPCPKNRLFTIVYGPIVSGTPIAPEATKQCIMSTENELIEFLANEIGSYLGRNPEAADGIEGIMQWWLSPSLPGNTRERVRIALERLEQRNVVMRSVLRDSTEVFSKRPAGHIDP